MDDRFRGTSCCEGVAVEGIYDGNEDEPLIEECLTRWFGDEAPDSRCSDFMRHYAGWIESLPEEMRSEAKNHLREFQYFSHKKSNDHLIALFKKINKCEYWNSDEAVFTYIPKKGGIANSSFDLLTEFRMLNSIPSECIIVDHQELKQVVAQKVSTIIFVDDFCGSGSSFIKYIENSGNVFSSTRLVYAVICGMTEGLASVVKELSHLAADVRTVSIVEMEAYYGSENPPGKVITKKCSGMLGIGDKFALGFNESQALVAFYENTPNNTLGYIWKCPKEGTYRPIFPRKKSIRPKWKDMKREKRCRERANYQNESCGGDD